MNTKFRILACVALMATVLTYIGCKKPQYSFGDITAPANVTLNTTIVGADATNPNGTGSGNVNITVTASKAITYKLDYGDGTSEIVPSGTVTHKYTNTGTFDYIVTATAVGTGGTASTVNKKIKVFVLYKIPDDILQNLTGGSSKTWVTDRTAPGHVGVGPTNTFSPDYYAAGPNERAACLYDDLITFTKDANGGISMSIDNKGDSFFIAAATSFYGKSGGDNCYSIDVSGTRKLAFTDATSASTSANSTRVQFTVPGNGLINFGTGGTTYEILSLTATTITLRNIGIDGLAWYQKLKVKP